MPLIAATRPASLRRSAAPGDLPVRGAAVQAVPSVPRSRVGRRQVQAAVSAAHHRRRRAHRGRRGGTLCVRAARSCISSRRFLRQSQIATQTTARTRRYFMRCFQAGGRASTTSSTKREPT